MNYDRTNYYNKKELKERGWTDVILKKFNIEWDLERPNPHYRSAPTTKLYLIEKINPIEETEQFKIEIEKSNKRKKSSIKAIETKKQNLIKLIDELPEPIIPIIKEKQLYKEALEQYNDFYAYVRNRPDKCIKNPNISTKKRLAVNYIRHQLTHYDEDLDHIFGKVGKDDAYILLKNNTLNAIKKYYPYLEDEVNNQLL